MAIKILVKRGTGFPLPANVDVGELAFSSNHDKFFIGDGAGSPIEIGSKGLTTFFQAPIIGEVAASASPDNIGDRYIVGTGGEAHFGAGLGDIVEWDGTAWQVVFDAAVEQAGAIVWDTASGSLKQFVDGSPPTWGLIEANTDLQEAYEAGNTITLDASNGPVEITGSGTESSALHVTQTDEQPLRLTQSGDGAHIQFNPADPTAASPDNLAPGDFWFGGAGFLYSDNGTDIRTLANLEDVQTFSGNLTLSGTNTLSGTVTTSGTGEKINVATGGYITIVDAPANDTDAVNKAYADGIAAGVKAKESVRVATAAALGTVESPTVTWTAAGSGVGKTLTAGTVGLSVIDGVTLVDGDRVLVKDQVNAVDNGVYVASATDAGSATVLTRADDADGTPVGEVSTGMFVFVEEGTANSFTGWMLFEQVGSPLSSDYTVDVDEQNFTQFQGLPQLEGGEGIDVTTGEKATISLDIELITTEITTAAANDFIAISGGSPNSISKINFGNFEDSLNINNIFGAAPQGSVIVANTANALTALDGSTAADNSATTDALLGYNAASPGDQVLWTTTIDGGSF